VIQEIINPNLRYEATRITKKMLIKLIHSQSMWCSIIILRNGQTKCSFLPLHRCDPVHQGQGGNYPAAGYAGALWYGV